MANQKKNTTQFLSKQNLTRDDIRETAVVLPDGSEYAVRFRPLSVRTVMEFANVDESASEDQVQRIASVLAGALVEEDGDLMFDDADELLELPADSLIAVMQAITDTIISKEVDRQGNA